jgi:hypothetical protein
MMRATIIIETTRGDVRVTEYQTLLPTASGGEGRPTRSEMETYEAAVKAGRTWLRGHVASEAATRGRREVRPPAPNGEPTP